jgi:hypothetical protein
MSPPAYPVPHNWGYGMDYIGDLEQDPDVDPYALLKVENDNNNKEGSGDEKENEFESNIEVSNKPNYAEVFLSYTNDSFDEQMYSSYQESMKNQVDTTDTTKEKETDDATETEKKTDDVVEDNVVKECKYCKSTPCLLPYVYDEMMFVAGGMEEDEVPNKEIRYDKCVISRRDRVQILG